ncbi:MAG TPA: hypothetical protein VK738_02150 [Terriglobales bacterium]|jgi:hypothetical protein|nr:hypothetical protein [Terriglobales bacterium]
MKKEITLLNDKVEAELPSLSQQCEELGRILGLDGPVRKEVLKAAIEDSAYANNLLVCRGNQEFLKVLLSKPQARQPSENSGMELIRKGAEALLRWGCTGFSVVSDEIFRERLSACVECPHLSSPREGNRLLYMIAGAASKDRAVCSRCGCVVARKARLTSESCPEPHPSVPGLSRWNEPMV